MITTWINKKLCMKARTPLEGWACVWAWMGVIFCLSAIPGPLLPKTTADAFLHRATHFVEYSILAFLVSRTVWHHIPRWRTGLWLFCTLSVVVSYAVFDEWHQTFVPGRSGQGVDVLWDIVYGCCGLLAYFFLMKRLSSKTY